MVNFLLKMYFGVLLKSGIGDGVFFRKRGRDQYIWQRGDYSALIYAEMLAAGHGVEIDVRSIDSWLPPHADEKLDLNDRERILRDFCYFLDRENTKYVLRK